MFILYTFSSINFLESLPCQANVGPVKQTSAISMWVFIFACVSLPRDETQRPTPRRKRDGETIQWTLRKGSA